MSLKKLKKLACEAYTLRHLTREFSGFVRACQVVGIELYLTVGGNGVIVRTPKFWVERFTLAGHPVWNIFIR